MRSDSDATGQLWCLDPLVEVGIVVELSGFCTESDARNIHACFWRAFRGVFPDGFLTCTSQHEL